MASLKFKTESPYVDIDKREFHHTDWKHINYMNNVIPSGGSQADQQSWNVVRMALFGIGRAGTYHLINILAHRSIELKYIIEGDTTKWEAAIAHFNLKTVKFLTPEEVNVMYEDPEVDSVIVATPTNTHEKIITGCLQSGKAVFTEKPVAATPEEMGNVYQLAKQVGKPLFCGFNRRFDPSFNRVYQDIRKGHIGQILQIKLTSRDSPLPPIWYLKTSGGIFYDCMVHDLDLMTHLLGEFPIEVFAMAVANFPEIKEIGEHDSVVATFKYQSGTIGVVDVSRHCPYGHDQRIEVFGHKGMLQVENDNPDRGSYFTADGITRPPMYQSFQSRHMQAYANELDHFVDIVLGRVETSVTEEMTKGVGKIGEACKESVKTGLPVKIKWTKEEIPKNYVMNV